MRKLVLLTTLVLGSSVAFAQFQGPQSTGNFSNNTNNIINSAYVTTIKDLDNLADDSRVTLEGKIVKYLGDEDYLFQDGTGEIVIEIDHEDWRGIQVGPEDTIVIHGEVDKHHFRATDIDVDAVSVKK